MRTFFLSLAVAVSSLACSAEVVDPSDTAPPGNSTDACEITGTVTLAPASANHSIGGVCIAAAAVTERNDLALCHVLAARHTGGACTCDAAARLPVTPTQHANADALRASTGADCVCEIPELAGHDGERCREAAENASGFGDGFCYIDATTTPPIGNAVIASACHAEGPHLVRLAGAASVAVPGASAETLSVQCDLPCP